MEIYAIELVLYKKEIEATFFIKSELGLGTFHTKGVKAYKQYNCSMKKSKNFFIKVYDDNHNEIFLPKGLNII